jgi:hypothetical protein
MGLGVPLIIAIVALAFLLGRRKRKVQIPSLLPDGMPGPAAPVSGEQGGMAQQNNVQPPPAGSPAIEKAKINGTPTVTTVNEILPTHTPTSAGPPAYEINGRTVSTRPGYEIDGSVAAMRTPEQEADGILIASQGRMNELDIGQRPFGVTSPIHELGSH